MGLISYFTNVGQNTIAGHSLYTKWGINRAIASAAPEWIWSANQAYPAWNDEPETVDISSSSDEDKPGGTGWQSIFLEYVNGNYDWTQTILTLDGQTDVQLEDCIYIRRMNAFAPPAAVGSAEMNVGDISAIGQTSGNLIQYVAAGDGTTMAFFDIIPRGHELHLSGLHYSAMRLVGGQSPRITMKVWAQLAGFGKALARQDVLDVDVQNVLLADFTSSPYVIPEMARVWVEATTDQDNTILSATGLGVLIKG